MNNGGHEPETHDADILEARIVLARRYGWESRARWCEALKGVIAPGYVLYRLDQLNQEMGSPS